MSVDETEARSFHFTDIAKLTIAGSPAVVTRVCDGHGAPCAAPAAARQPVESEARPVGGTVGPGG